MGNGDSGEEEEGSKDVLEPVTSIAKSIVLMKLLNNSYTCSGLVRVMNRTFWWFGESDEQNILN